MEEVIQVSRKNDFVQPTVFQGNYNPISRRPETELFPILRKHGIAFHAYSPIAGGFLAKTKKQIVQGECTGRWNPNSSIGGLYHALYNKPKYLQALDVWADISASSGIERAELAYRWMAYHSYIETSLGDAIVIGASSIPQLERTLAGLRNGPLPVDVVKQIDEIWTLVENESVLDNFSPFRSSIR